MGLQRPRGQGRRRYLQDRELRSYVSTGLWDGILRSLEGRGAWASMTLGDMVPAFHLLTVTRGHGQILPVSGSQDHQL